LILMLVIIAAAILTVVFFTGSLKSYVPVTLTSDRAGLVMETGGKVKLRGVQVGKVTQITGGNDPVSLKLDIYPDQIQYIPANVEARIRATTAFGAKYVDLMYPDHPSPQRLAADTVIKSENVSTEVNTVFQNLTGVLDQVDPAKLNAVLTAFAEGLRGQGATIGEGITDGNQVLTALNERSETIRADFQSFKGFADTYSAAAPDLVKILDAASTTSATITANADALDSLLLSTVGFSRSGIALLGPAKDNLVGAINGLQSTTSLLMKYNPELTCLLVGGKTLLDNGYADALGGNGRTAVLDAALLLGKDAYRYPDNLSIVGAKGGPGGKPGCGSLPDVAKNFPVRYMVTNTGWGTGLDLRPNPGIGKPWFAYYFPTTRAVPQPPTLVGQGPPAKGPNPPYPGAPAYAAPEYAPDSTPLYPGLPPAPPPGAPRDSGPTPGAEPFVVPYPGQLQPTPPSPVPEAAAPSP
jgi:phospholipid/cholesterol/gamma-HCH transport system substrate-binding protein